MSSDTAPFLALILNFLLPSIKSHHATVLSRVSSAVSFLLLGSDGPQVWRRLQRFLLDVLDGHHASQEGVAQHGAQSHQSRQELFPPLVGHVIEVGALSSLRGRLLTGAL